MAAASRSARDGSKSLGSAAPFEAKKQSDAIEIDSAPKLRIRHSIFHMSVKPPVNMRAPREMEPQLRRRSLVERTVDIDDFAIFGNPGSRGSFDRCPEPIGSLPDFV
jgi:hypothetical protein